jgi:methionyl-tRNA formyltransferase
MKNEKIKYLFLAGIYPKIDARILEVLLEVNPTLQVFHGDMRTNPAILEHTKNIKELDSIITVYWPFIVPMDFCNSASITVNFHPALLPINRGWYPHVHSIIDGSPAGVTLHKLSEEADQGDIWAQQKIEIQPWENAGDVYIKLQASITQLFVENWELIATGKIIPWQQDESMAVYHSKKEIDSMDEIDLNRSYLAGDFLNLLRARTFGERGFAYFEVNGKKIKVRIELVPEIKDF